ncbi:MAG: D-cysteine desulfhydrase family protein [Pseudomonadales bacterium]
MNRSWLDSAPRVPLAHVPTPLVPLDRLSQALGGPRVWLKRDDCTGLATGGNKTRKLEYLLADAQAAGADTIVTFGAVQSNHARQTAAACAAVGLPCHLILTRRVRWSHPLYESSGNVLLDRLLGATLHLVTPDAASAAARELTGRLEAEGRRPYVIPTGGSDPVGALGYARCALELLEQSRERGFTLTDVMHATASAGTQSGLVAGFAALCGDGSLPRPRVHGIDVYNQTPERLNEAVLTISREALRRRGASGDIEPADVRVDNRYVGEDYGIPTEGTLEAIRLLGSTEGVLMDPCYSGKGFSGLIDRVRRGEFAHTEDLVFIHTGGVAALAVYDNAFATD